MFIRFFHNTYLYAFVIPFSCPKSQPLFLRKCDSILSQQTQPNNATPARYCCGFPSIGLHPFLIHTLIRKVRDTLQDLPFPTSRTFKSVSFEPIPFLPNPFVQLPGSSLSLRFALSSLLFPFGSSFPLGKTYCRKGFQSQMKERTNPASEKNIQETSSAFLFSVGSCFLFSSLSVILIYRFFSHLSSTFQ